MAATPSRSAQQRRSTSTSPALAGRLTAVGSVRQGPHLVRLSVPPHELTIFRDGRAIVKGTSEIPLARSLYARYVGT